MKRLLISGSGSGCGKTTIVCAIMSAFKQAGYDIASFKCGPDYIDPMFHSELSKVPAYNLDPFFLNKQTLIEHLHRHSADLSIIEGAMGFYDGIGSTYSASAYTVASWTNTPVVLVVNAKGAAHSLAAHIKGFAQYKEDSGIKGVIFNNASKKRYPDLVEIAKQAGVKAYGYLPYNAHWSIASRKMGLLSTSEIEDLQSILHNLGLQAAESIDIQALYQLSKTAMHSSDSFTASVVQNKHEEKLAIQNPLGNRPKLAVAKDKAFCFYYQENLDMLEDLGTKLVFFSPLLDKKLPVGISGLYLGGGYPNLYTKELSENASMRNSIKQHLQKGMPCLAEGTAYTYLHKSVDDLDMCGVIDAKAYSSDSIQNFGYIYMHAEVDNILCNKGECIASREFTYFKTDAKQNAFMAKKAGKHYEYSCCIANTNMYAGFPTIYFPSNRKMAENFVERIRNYES